MCAHVRHYHRRSVRHPLFLCQTKNLSPRVLQRCQLCLTLIIPDSSNLPLSYPLLFHSHIRRKTYPNMITSHNLEYIDTYSTSRSISCQILCQRFTSPHQFCFLLLSSNCDQTNCSASRALRISPTSTVRHGSQADTHHMGEELAYTYCTRYQAPHAELHTRANLRFFTRRLQTRPETVADFSFSKSKRTPKLNPRDHLWQAIGGGGDSVRAQGLLRIHRS